MDEVFGPNEESNPLWEVKQAFIRHKQHFLQVFKDDEDAHRRERTRKFVLEAEAREDANRVLAERQAAERGSTWGRVDPQQALEAARNPREPEVGRFTQTADEPPHGVFYRGCVNEIHGESESGKSWLALYAVAQELGAGHVVAYVDYEDDEGSVYRRLTLLGISESVLLGDQFRYIRPNGPLTEPEKAAFVISTADADAVILDGVTEGMSLEGLSPRDEADVAAWHAKVTKDLAHAGKCVVVIDHTPHDGNRTIGSQHKKACISGVSYMADPLQPIAPGQRGVLRLRVEKDRPGSVRREAASGTRPQWRGDLVVDFSEGRSRPDVALFPASPREGAEGPEIEVEMKPPMAVCTAILSFVAENPGASSSDIQSAIQAGKAKLLRAVKWLVAQGYLRKEQEGRSVAHRVTGLELTAEVFGGDQASG
ncbi:hypothetical protein [Streptomyces sp. SP17KL33]|uniref:hypothetical protein n=1 Tax=Streptomyces sp. SP17KL33 TaxID=3002534 RepID=UPI002E79B44D|nr:hypothetical protein [Streptomyces sp. SP17KL33]MEE1834910.1 hypothetical protein [Streptomyces sp. SP17KL33]